MGAALRIAILLALALVSLHTHARADDGRPPVILLPGLAGSRLQARLGPEYRSPHWYCHRGSECSKWQDVWLLLTDYVLPSCLNAELRVFTRETNASSEAGRHDQYDHHKKKKKKKHHHHHHTKVLEYANAPGVEVRAVDFGGLSGISSLDPYAQSASQYFAPLIAALEKAGWKAGESLFGAPYDFRFAADGLQASGFHEAMAGLVERAVDASGGKRAYLLAHSMGGLVGWHFLATRSEAWLEAHVAGFVTVSTPFGGSPLAPRSSISGDNFGGCNTTRGMTRHLAIADVSIRPPPFLPLPFLPSPYPPFDPPILYRTGLDFAHDVFLGVQATSPSGPWLFPAQGLWRGEQGRQGREEEDDERAVIVRTRTQNYTAASSDMAAMLMALGREGQALAQPVVRDLRFDAGAVGSGASLSLDAPGGPAFPPLPPFLKLSCIHSAGVATGAQFFYDVEAFNASGGPMAGLPAPAIERVVDGDGVVDAASLAHCARLPGVKHFAPVFGSDHIKILSTPELHAKVIAALGAAAPHAA